MEDKKIIIVNGEPGKFIAFYQEYPNVIASGTSASNAQKNLDKLFNEVVENSLNSYDSTSDTLKHIKRVQELLNIAAIELINRGNIHDNSKLNEPEKSEFDRLTPKLKTLTYNSQEYKDSLKELGIALKHHYENNSHHPEHYVHGINDMNLFDILEMFIDWKAASERHNNGNIWKSFDENRERFKMSDQLYWIFRNTAKYLKFDGELENEIEKFPKMKVPNKSFADDIIPVKPITEPSLNTMHFKYEFKLEEDKSSKWSDSWPKVNEIECAAEAQLTKCIDKIETKEDIEKYSYLKWKESPQIGDFIFEWDMGGWKSLAGRAGLSIVRNNKIICSQLTRMS